ncbi:MAG: thioredoxin-like domain-containing protein, partial [bacterium]
MRLTAPELTGGVGWLNTDTPLTLKQLRGKIVLLDFWTFCCINCIHIVPELHKLEQKYPHELVIIGVHSAKFENEKDSQNIEKAILRYDVEHPVINDANFKLWNAYAVHAWPTLVLIDPNGKIVSTLSGEGNTDVLDRMIQGLIEEYGKSGKLNRSPMHFNLDKDKAKKAPLAFPGKIAADPATNRLFISDSGHNRIIVAHYSGKVLDVIGSGAVGKSDGTFAQATFHHPQGLAYHDNKLFVADTENHLIRSIDLNTKKVSTLAGTGEQAPFRADGGPARTTALN